MRFILARQKLPLTPDLLQTYCQKHNSAINNPSSIVRYPVFRCNNLTSFRGQKTVCATWSRSTQRGLKRRSSWK